VRSGGFDSEGSFEISPSNHNQVDFHSGQGTYGSFVDFTEEPRKMRILWGASATAPIYGAIP
jgi:hypothetical protein